MDKSVREKRGRNAIIVGISGNAFLAIFNFIIGTLSGSTALVAEAAHTFADILDSSIAFIGFKIGLKPPDIEHPYGHGRAESLAGLISVIFLAFIAYEILLDVYSKLLLGGALTPPNLTAALMALVGIIINYSMTTYMSRVGHEINSPAITSDAKHQRVDIFTSVAIFAGVIGSRLGVPILDPLVALFIVALVLKTAFEVARDNINNIMGKIPSDQLLPNIEATTLSVEGGQEFILLK